MRQYHFAIMFDEETNRWDIDIDTEESAFPNGTIYNTETKEWEYGYAGDDKFTGREEEILQRLSKLLDIGNN
jgi:hypothetical protein